MAALSGLQSRRGSQGPGTQLTDRQAALRLTLLASSESWPGLSPAPPEHSVHYFALQVSMAPQCSRAGLGLQKPVLMPGLAQTC